MVTQNMLRNCEENGPFCEEKDQKPEADQITEMSVQQFLSYHLKQVEVVLTYIDS